MGTLDWLFDHITNTVHLSQGAFEANSDVMRCDEVKLLNVNIITRPNLIVQCCDTALAF